MRPRIFSLLLLGLFLPSFIHAQENTAPEKWYWAWREGTGELLAYTADGAVNVLPLSLEDPLSVWTYEYWKLTDQMGLLLIWETYLNRFILYQITSDSVKEIEPLFDLANINIVTATNLVCAEWEVQTVYGMRVVLVSSSCGSAILVLDLATSTLEFVGYTNRDNYCSDYYRKCIGVSSDATNIRYIRPADRDEKGRFLNPLTIIEWDAAEAKERVVYAHEPDAGEENVSCHPDFFGERWLCKTQSRVGDEVFTKYRVITLDGKAQLILSDETFWRWDVFFSGNDLIEFYYPCENDCKVKITHENEVEYFPYKFENIGTGPIQFARLLNNGTVLIQTLSEYFVVTHEGEFYQLGFILERYRFPVSGRFLVTNDSITSANTFQIWDVLDRRLLFDFEPNIKWDIDLFENGFIVRNDEAAQPEDNQQWVYSSQLGQVFELPYPEADYYFELLRDGTLLYDACSSVLMHKGIYRYDPQSEQFIAIILGVTPIWSNALPC